MSAFIMYRRLLIAALLGAVVLGGLWFFRSPIVAAVKEWRASSLVSKAEKAAEDGRARESVQVAMAAWQLGPKKLTTLRRLMIHGRAVGMPELASISLVIFFHDEHEPSDRSDILKWTLDRGEVTLFDQLYPNLDESSRQDPAIRLLYARKLGLQGRTLEAIEEARALESDEALGAQVSLLLGNLLPRLPGNPVALKQAAERFHRLLNHEDDEIAMSAWRSLRQLPENVRDPGPEFDPVAWVSAREGANAGDRVYARRFVMERLPKEAQDAELRKIASEFLGDAEAIGWVVRWYLEEGHGELLLELPESAFVGESGIFSARLQVLLETGKLDEAAKWLEKAPEGFPEGVAGSLRAVFASRAGRSSEALSAWRRVIGHASSLQLYGDCVSILRIAEKFGEQRAGVEIVDVIISLPSNRLPASENLGYLEPYFAARADEWLKFWRELFRNRPGDGVAAEQVAFLELLHPEEADGSIFLERTEQLLVRFPTAPRFRATRALWLINEGKNTEALELLRAADINWNETDPVAGAVYAIALRRSGATSEALALEAGLRWERVGPVRRAILTSFLNSGAVPAGS
jgi:tetratricopeptide (TPR) repeat protein